MSVILSLAAMLCAAPPQSSGDAVTQQPPQFAAPIRLMTEGEPLGQKLLYPSPRLFDIDSDGVAELVIGDLSGRVRVAEKLDGGPEAWGALKPFETDGRPLKFNNW